MDLKPENDTFKQLLDAREEIRGRLCLIGLAGPWHLAKARRIARDPSRARSIASLAVQDDELDQYVKEIVALVPRLEAQDQWCLQLGEESQESADKSEFLKERATLIEMYGVLQLRLRTYERAAREPANPTLSRARQLLESAASSAEDLAKIEATVRMRIRDYVAEEDAIASAVAKIDAAKTEIMAEYKPWAIAVAHDAHGADTALEHAALIGLSKAIDNYDFRRGYRLTTYAQHWISAEITNVVT